MWFWILGGVAIWILGMIVFYILDGWFDYGFKEGETGLVIFIAIIWPLWIGFFIPGMLAHKAHEVLKAKKEKYNKEKEKLTQIRIAEEKEIEKIEEELESFVKESRKAG